MNERAAECRERTTVSKNQSGGNKQSLDPQQRLLEADAELQDAASQFGEDDTCDAALLANVREKALAFAAAWHACGAVRR